ncbi:hypothetical protein L207DRAFT_506059 [Hyaloscypha variabilis F]|uniref:Ryanodine receptor Ryr domain-containing protein n=1 Tax=Hyaloscypha variabilis (strain UAMH 11265 / GT02V1 / F) TaxID=1149755 RepID=A0A2J6S879_HYAVF|nr:hypothetical protein L207DRAFT_506059 [Hyaloscypha variabilis F]
MSDSHILVAGDTPVDLLVYPSRDADQSYPGQPKFCVHRCNGGATLIAELLHASQNEHKQQVHEPAFEVPRENFAEQSASFITELEVFGKAAKPPYSFKVKRRQQLITKPVWYPPRTPIKKHDKASVLVFQDAEFGFKNPNDAVDFFRKSRSGTMIYHMARPLGTGEIWDAVRHGPIAMDGLQDPMKLIVVVSSDDLRAEGIDLSYGLSWEKTCEDFVEKIGKLETLATCANLLILFGCDGVIWHRGRKMSEPVLFFDPLSVEGRFTRQNIGYVPGIAEAFIGGLATKVAQLPPRAELHQSIEFGFIAARRLAKLGFRNHEIHDWPRYPFSDIMEKAELPEEAPNTLDIPSESMSAGARRWSILHHNIGDPVQVACHMVMKGTYYTANWIPIARFGDLIILDRSETEGFRTIFNAMHEYLSAPQTKPLNIAIFGPKGSGKSFAAGQVAGTAAAAVAAAAATSPRKIQHVRVDLSQFTSFENLSAAFNKVRECNLSGILPLVSIKAFDTEYAGSPLGWLAHLLPAMHGGQILDRGEMKHIGPAILLLGSSYTNSLENFEAFSEKQGNEKDALRAQEFLSCLHAFVDVIGLDQVNSSDVWYPVRRAVVLRALLEDREPKLKMSEGISIDQSVLDGLLMIPTYRHGLRSLKAIIAMSNITGKHHFERAALPPEAQLALHFDYPTFMECSRYNTLSDDLRETLAEGLHNFYIKIRKATAKTDKEKADLLKDPSLAPWPSIKEDLRESSRAHAIDIPRKLRMISCFLSERLDKHNLVERFTDDELRFLAEQEHERWNAERMQQQWALGQRSGEKRTSPFLKPLRDLSPEWQNVDREMVKSYISILPENYGIYRIGKFEKADLRDGTVGFKGQAITAP